jgi:hypothetical protein
MGGEEAVRELVALAEKAGVEVRIEPFGLAQLRGKGGLCRIRGRQVILVDASLGPVEQAGVIGEALGSVDLGAIAIPEGLGPFLKSGHAKIRALVRPRPLARGRKRRHDM